MKYYVYVEKKNGEAINHIFVEDLDEFVTHQFDPSRLSFTGVVIDASDVFVAKQAYDSPHESHVEATIAWIPEPSETANYSAAAKTKDQLDLVAHMLRCSTLAIKVAKSLQECNKQLAELAHYIRIFNTKNPEANKEAVFKRLKERYIEHFQRLRYKPYTPNKE
jgi:hypothetical protein